MTETLISPGVLGRETDTSFITRGPVTVGAAIVGPTAKGPVNMPTVVTTYSEYESIFGRQVTSGSNQYTYLTSISANNYFQQGGSSLLVTRVADEDFTPATSQVLNEEASPSFEIFTLSEGVQMNNTALSGSSEIPTSGALISGSKENIRWEVANTDTRKGTFDLIIRRGDDTTKNKIILEQWRGLSLDPDSNSFIERVIGNTSYEIVEESGESFVVPMGTYKNNSSYIIVKNTLPTVGYLDNNGEPKEIYEGFLPTPSSGSFLGASGNQYSTSSQANFYDKIDDSNTQGLSVSENEVSAYDNALNILLSKESYQFNVITAPGLTANLHGQTVKKLVSLAESRQDCIAIIDLAGFNVNSISTVQQLATEFDSSYASTYWPWVQIIDSGKAVWAPASTVMPGVFAFTDASSEPWFSPAGMTRGGLGRVIQPSRKLTTKNRGDLYSYNINPITFFPNNGVVVFGQKTLQKKGSALDRVNVRRLLIELKGYISQIADTLVFEQNTSATRNYFISRVNPYLETVQQRQGLYAFKVTMDESNNDAASIDRNELRGQILLQPAKTIEYILLDFNITPTGADFGQ